MCRCPGCEACGPIACGATTNLTLDHVIPRSKGGSNRLENLQLLCQPCNLAKGDKLPKDAAA
jgi:5-methylcytosine-specific restriction endonuclease McrA